MKMAVIFAVAFALLFVTCATKPRVDRHRDWNAFIASHSHDQTLAELGRPYVTGGQNDGSRFAEGVIRRSPQVSAGFGVGAGSFRQHSSVSGGAGTTISPPPHGEYLHLDFGTNGLLKA